MKRKPRMRALKQICTPIKAIIYQKMQVEKPLYLIQLQTNHRLDKQLMMLLRVAMQNQFIIIIQKQEKLLMTQMILYVKQKMYHMKINVKLIFAHLDTREVGLENVILVRSENIILIEVAMLKHSKDLRLVTIN